VEYLNKRVEERVMILEKNKTLHNEVMNIMQKAHADDIEAYNNKYPAFNKLLKSKKVFDELKK